MPESTVRISDGGVQDRLSTGFMDQLYVTCVAVTDEAGETVLIYSQDLHNTNDSYVIPAKEAISEARQNLSAPCFDPYGDIRQWTR